MTTFNGKATITYYEIMDNDFTGVKVTIKSNDGNMIKQFVNFDSEDYDGVYANQTETFEINVESYIAMYEHNHNYAANQDS